MTQFERVNKMEGAIIEQLGYEGAFEALVRALSTDTKEEMYEYIFEQYEIESEEI